MAQRVSASSLRKTRNFDFLFGRYSLSDKAIPYFQVSMNFKDASDYLELIDNLPGSSSINWRVEELFQRDIDWDRVHRGLVPYLSDSERPQFFNSLTIALIPRKGVKLHGYSKDIRWNPPQLENREAFEKIFTSGPISIGYWECWNEIGQDSAKIGQLSWNQDEVVAVAIDGQHRLAAIKEITQQNTLKNASVPVILLVFDEGLGFNGTETTYRSTIQILRRLFIDLNKNARTVKRARQILLDDRDPVSICVRMIVDNQLKKGLDDLYSEPAKLPLTLVDWHTEQAKFEDGPYLTTILGLDWIVSQLLNIKPVESGVDYTRLGRNIKSLRRSLDIDLNKAIKRLEECEKLEKPFNFTDGEDDPKDNELDLIAKGFEKTWVGPIIKIISEFIPYKELIDLRKVSETLCPEFANWYSLRVNIANTHSKTNYLKARMNNLEDELKNRDEDPIYIGNYIDSLQEFTMLKIEQKLAYTVVFQRALFLAFKSFAIIKDEYAPVTSFNDEDLDILDESDFEDDIDQEEEICVDQVQSENLLLDRRTEEFIDALNRIYKQEPGIMDPNHEYYIFETNMSERFWQGSLCHPDGTMDYSQAASIRGSDLILSIAIMSLIFKHQRPSDFEELYQKTLDSTTGLYTRLNYSLRSMSKQNSIADRILKTREIPDSGRTEEECRKIIRPRLEWLWALYVKSQ